MANDQNGIHALPILSRPPLNIRQRCLGLLWAITFNVACVTIVATQFLFLVPLRIIIAIVPIPLLQRLYETGVRRTKGSFGELAVLMCQWFSPTQIVVTLEGDNLKEEEVVVRDSSGRIVRLCLPEKLIIIANHQIYADWWYLWCLLYWARMHTDVLIILKDSLKWIPILGWGMQMYHFIFIARSWASDRLLLSKKLSKLATRTELLATPLAFMIYPEGTLVSANTRPISKKFAEKSGIEDMRNMLLPRSTGLQYCLRSLSPQIPDLHLLDVTILYEGKLDMFTHNHVVGADWDLQGIPPQGYGQSYYTLRSIFMDGIPPPRIHMHLRLYDVRKDVPFDGTQSESSSVKHAANFVHTQNGQASQADRENWIDPAPEDVARFEVWLRELWREKDTLVDRCLETGTFSEHFNTDTSNPKFSTDSQQNRHAGEINLPIKLRTLWDIFGAFGYFAPVIVWAAWRWTFS